MPDNRALDIRLAKLRGWTKIIESPLVFPCGINPETHRRERLPSYTTSLDPHFHDVWPEIEKRGLDEAYLTKLAEMGWNTDGDPWLLLKVPPEEHTRAAIAVLGGQ